METKTNKFEIGQTISLNGSYYLVIDLAPTGLPNVLHLSDIYGKVLHPESDAIKASDMDIGFSLNWKVVTPLNIANAKYEKVIRKINQLDKRFEDRQKGKLNAKNLEDAINRMNAGEISVPSHYFTTSVGTLTWSNTSSDLSF